MSDLDMAMQAVAAVEAKLAASKAALNQATTCHEQNLRDAHDARKQLNRVVEATVRGLATPQA